MVCASKSSEDSAIEEGVLSTCETGAIDCVHCGGEAENSDQAYKDWLHIRESNVVLALIFKLFGCGRAQPTLLERFMLFLLYAGVLFLGNAVLTNAKGHICRDSYVGMCVPVAQGGQCDEIAGAAPTDPFSNETCGCASNVTLGQTPARYSDYERVAARTNHEQDLQALMESSSGLPVGTCPCSLPMCGTISCTFDNCSSALVDLGNETVGVCECEEDWDDGNILNSLWSTLYMTVLMKVFYTPLRYYYMMEVTCKCVWIPCHCCICFLVTCLFVAGLKAGGAHGTSNYDLSVWGILMVTFSVFDALKGFVLGYLVGTFVIGKCLGQTAKKCWRIAFA